MKTNNQKNLIKHVLLSLILGVLAVLMEVSLIRALDQTSYQLLLLNKQWLQFHFIIFLVAGILSFFLAYSKFKLRQAHVIINSSQAEKQKVNEELKEYKFALDQSAVITVIDEYGKVKRINKNFEELTGFKEKDVIGRSVWRLPSSLQNTSIFKSIKSTCDAGQVWKGEIEYYKEDGNIVFTSAIVVPLSQKKDGNNDCLVIQYDITAEKKSALALYKSEKEKDFILSNTQTLICSHNLDGVFTNINSAGASILEYSKDEIVGKSLSCFLDSHLSIRPYLDEIIDNGHSEGYMKIRTKSGKGRILFFKNTVITDESGTYIIGSAVDFTEKIEEQRELENQQLFVRQIVNTSPNLIWVVDEEGAIKLVNENFLRFFDIKDDALMKDIYSYAEDRPGLKQLMSLDLNSEKNKMKYAVYESKFVNRRTGEDEWYKVQTTTFEDKKGKKYKSFIATDISDKNASEAKLIKAHAMVEGSLRIKEQFIANMSHEIRTPLNAIVGFTDLLDDTALDTQQRDYVKTVKIAGQNLLSIINDILDLSKIESGNIHLCKKPFNLSEAIMNVKKLFEPKVLEKQIGLDAFISNALPEIVFGDEVRLNQVLINLVGNAVKFTNSGSVEIIAKAIKKNVDGISNVQFIIKDSGIGIEKDKLNMIFERYSQASKDTHKIFGGTGLGLNISKNLIELLGGEIKIDSEFGVGTTFSFMLPLATDGDFDLLPVTKQTAEEVIEYRSAVKILLAEDNDTNAKLAMQVLKKRNYIVERVRDGVQVLDALEHNVYDIILMDVQMLHMDGLEATKIIRSRKASYSNIPIIALTAHSFNGERNVCDIAGMNGYISKPFSPQELFNAINSMLANRNFLAKPGMINQTVDSIVN